MRNLSLCLSLLILAVLSSGQARAATEYLIVTTDALAPAFGPFSDAKSDAGYETEIATLEQLDALAVPGRDQAEQVRNYIQSVYADGSLRFVLLAGDTDILPTRMAFDDLFPAYGSEIATDLYFAALDGDWDANGNDVFGEVDVDLVDVGPEIAVGRVPVSTFQQAEQYVAKVAAFQDRPDRPRTALYLGEVLFPSDWSPGEMIQLDGATICEDASSLIPSGPLPVTIARLYENEVPFAGAGHLSVSDAVAAMNSGDFEVLFHVGHGWEETLSMGDGRFESPEALGLTNGPDSFFMVSGAPGTAAFHHDAILEDLIRNPSGGAVAAIGWSCVSFASTVAEFVEEMGAATFVDEPVAIGDALNVVRNTYAAQAQGNTVWRWNLFGINLLGDPSLAPAATQSSTSSPAAVAGRLRLHSVTPNPFNPNLSVAFEVLGAGSSLVPVEVDVYDQAGRRVRHLFTGRVGSGEQSLDWDGADDSGRAMASGVYFVAIDSGSQRVVAKATLLK